MSSIKIIQSSAYKRAIKTVRAQAKKLGRDPTKNECVENLKKSGLKFHAKVIEDSPEIEYNDFLCNEVY